MCGLVDARALDLVQVFEDPTAQRQAVTQTLGELGEREKAHVLVYRATLLAHVLLGHEAKAHVLLASSRLEPLGFARAQCPTGLLHAGTVSAEQQKRSEERQVGKEGGRKR